MDYEGQICRAPMERSSFMLPVMVGCSYNACRFCGLFKHLKYRALPFEQVEAELRRISSMGGNPKKIFLGDGNAFTFETEYLLKLISTVKGYFPGAETFNMDATVTSILEKSDHELKNLHDAGVRHLYIGIETGLDDVLHFMQKDHNLAEAHEAIERLHSAGLIYDAHIMTGIAGRGRGEENAFALAEFFNETHPAHVVNFSLFLHDRVPLYEDMVNGLFVPASELDNLKEARTLISHIEVDDGHPIKYDGFHDYISYRVRGTLPKDKEKMLNSLDKAIAEEAEEDRSMPIYSFTDASGKRFFNEETGRYIWDL
ncbi:MAG: radical SAM protein [Firmicutes bacterium]|nr:radical SAM protein [Bacillota bacterium]